MTHSTLAPVFTGFRIGLHALLVGLTVFVVARAFAVDPTSAPCTLAAAVAFVAVYSAGAWKVRRDAAVRIARRGLVVAWVVALTLLWAVLVWLTPESAFLVVPLFFLYLHLLPGAIGGAAIVLATGFAILAFGLHLGFSVGGVIGPLLGAGVALLIGLAYRALAREAEEREQLLAELTRTRRQLAETEREQGALAERARLAREIHDTVAQGLSSIQMLLRAAERDVPEPGAGYVRLARETAADSLADTRQIIRELTPSRLDDGLAAALRRLGEDQARRASVPVEVDAEEFELPMGAQTAMLRIAQGALSNAVRHAEATRIRIALVADSGPPDPADPAVGSVQLTVRDDGRGFDTRNPGTGPHDSDSFGLQAMRERVDQLGGTLEIVSSPGKGTAITARLPVAPGAGRRP